MINRPSVSSADATLLLAELLSGQVEAAKVSRSRWPVLVETARRHGLGPMLWHVLGDSGAETVDKTAWNSLVSEVQSGFVHQIYLEDARARIDAALKARGIRALWLKGIALARTVYPDPALRPMMDVDVLVPFEHRLAALAVVESLGYRRWGAYSFEDVPDLAHHFSYHFNLRGGTDDAISVELHFHLLDRIRNEPLLSTEQLAWFWTQAEATASPDSFLSLKPEAHLLYLCAHTILQHGEHDLNLSRIFDLHLLITKTSSSAGQVDWDLLVDRALSLGWADAVSRALELTVLYFGTDVPDRVLAALQLLRSRSTPLIINSVVERQISANRLQDLLPHLPDIGVWKALRLMRAILLPSQKHLRHRYLIPVRSAAWPWYLVLWSTQGIEAIRLVLSHAPHWPVRKTRLERRENG
jgi:hypothetical protein